MTLKQLMDLGAPSLPNGHFYRVRSNIFGIGYVEIHRKRRMWKSVLVASATVPRATKEGDAISVEDGIAFAAQKARKAVEDDMAEMDYWSDFRRFEGDHAHDWRTA